MRGIGDEIPANLLGHGGLGHVLDHEPSAAAHIGTQRCGFDDEITATQIGPGADI